MRYRGRAALQRRVRQLGKGTASAVPHSFPLNQLCPRVFVEDISNLAKHEEERRSSGEWVDHFPSKCVISYRAVTKRNTRKTIVLAISAPTTRNFMQNSQNRFIALIVTVIGQAPREIREGSPPYFLGLTSPATIEGGVLREYGLSGFSTSERL